MLSGDFCQLPPVPGRDQTGKQITPKFAFDAASWNACVGPPVTLTRVFRQKDQGLTLLVLVTAPSHVVDAAFVDMLNAMRFGKLDAKTTQAFKALSRPVVYTDGIEPTELYVAINLSYRQYSYIPAVSLPGEKWIMPTLVV